MQKKQIQTGAKHKKLMTIVKKKIKKIPIEFSSAFFSLLIQSDQFILSDEDEKSLLIQNEELKLCLEPIPKTCWYSNVRSSLKKSQWDKIRKVVFTKANFLCEICGGQGTLHPVECHEVWVYEDSSSTQRLDYFLSICPLCHEVKHLESARNLERAFKRFVEINKLDEITAIALLIAVFKEWQIRSRKTWTLDINHLKDYGIETEGLKCRTKLQSNNEQIFRKQIEVTTGNCSIKDCTAILEGTIENFDAYPFYYYGHFWSTNKDAVIPEFRNTGSKPYFNIISHKEPPTGKFISSLPVIPGTTYYFRAFVRSKGGRTMKCGDLKKLKC